MDMKISPLHEAGVRKHTLLLVDDSPVNLGVVVENLELQGYEVLVALDGEEGLLRAQETLPDIILLDVMMPGMDGFETCSRLKSDERTRDIPVIFMTSLSRLEDKIEGFGAGAVDYVTKPLQMDELRARVGAQLKLRDLQRQLEEKNRSLESEVEQRKQMERLIKQERNMLRAFLRALPGLAWMKDRDGRYMVCNPQLEKLFGVPESEITGKTDFDFMSAEAARYCLNTDEAVMQTGEPNRSEEWVTFISEGKDVLFEIVKAPVHGAQGGIAGTIGVAHDITERKRMEELLKKREREFRTLTENSPDMVVRHDCEGRFVYANPHFEKAAGLKLEVLRGRMPVEFPEFPGVEFFQQRILEVIATGRPDEFEHSAKSYGGGPEWMLVSMTPERDETGKIVYVQVLMRDISALKEAERSLEESRARLRQLLTYQEESREEERKKLSWDMHEDLLQMITSIQLNISILSAGLGEEDARHAKTMAALQAALGKSTQLVREMVVSLRPTVLNLGIAAALEWLVDEFSEKAGMACTLEIGELPEQPDEKSSLTIFRLVEEALAFSVKHRHESNMTIRLECAGNGSLLTIRDKSKGNGEAVPEDQFLNLFGLQERVMAMGGEMILFEEPGHGLIIEAQIPPQ